MAIVNEKKCAMSKHAQLTMGLQCSNAHKHYKQRNENTKEKISMKSNNEKETSNSSEPKGKQKQHTQKIILLRRFLPLLIVIEAALAERAHVLDLPFRPTFPSSEVPTAVHPDSIYVPGGGFSGFWFLMGQLQSIRDPTSKSYYCYSAGCLGVVATLSGKSMDEMLSLALDIQRRWKEGDISRYEVVPHFVDGLLFGADIKGQMTDGDSNAESATTPVVNMADPKLLSKVHVITTIKDSDGTHASVRTPTTIDELRDMLIQTTWIPWVTGNGLWTKDVLTGDYHMDGGFTARAHPRCARRLGMPFMFDLYADTLNMNLGRDKVEKYWSAGVVHGF